LLREETSLAAEMLRARGLSYDGVFAEVAHSAPTEPEHEATSSSAASARALDRIVPLSPVALHALTMAWEACDRRSHTQVTAEDLLAGIIRAGGSRAAKLLAARGVTLDTIQGEDET